jgi:hypothetical protein
VSEMPATGLPDFVRSLQDRVILTLGIERDQPELRRDLKQRFRQMMAVPPGVVARSEAERSRVLAPIILVDVVKDEVQPTFAIGDPALGTPAAPYGEWIEAWTIFQTILFRHTPEIHDGHDLDVWEPTDEVADESHRPSALHYLVPGIQSIAENHGPEAAEGFILRLWEHRWIHSARMCAALIESMHTHTEPAANGGIDAWSRAAFDAAVRELTTAKTTAETLDDWLESLYGLAPTLRLASSLNEQSTDPDRDKRDRFLEEAIVDLGTLFLGAARPDFDWIESLVAQELPDSDFRALRRRLSYKSSARVFFPRPWLESVLRCIEHGEAVSSELNTYDYLHTVALQASLEPAIWAVPLEWYDDPAPFGGSEH